MSKNTLKIKYELSKYECNHCGENAAYTVDDGNFITRLCKPCYEQLLVDMVSKINLAGHRGTKDTMILTNNIKIGNITNVTYTYDLGFRKVTVIKKAKILGISPSKTEEGFCAVELEYLD